MDDSVGMLFLLLGYSRGPNRLGATSDGGVAAALPEMARGARRWRWTALR